MNRSSRQIERSEDRACVVRWLVRGAALLWIAAPAAWAMAAATDAASPPVALRSGRPRIFADAQSFRQIAARCEKGGLMEPSYRAMLESLERPMNAKTAYYPRAWTGPQFGFVFRVETALGRGGDRYLRHIKEAMWKADGSGIDGLDFGWDAVIYDWIYDALTPSERTLYGNRIGRFLRHYTRVPEITLEGGTYWYNQTWSPVMGISWSRDGITAKTMVALAIAGEQTEHADDARRWLASFARRMPGEFAGKLDRLGGVWPEGPNHGNCCYAPFLAWEAWRFATGEDLFRPVARTGFHREAPYWRIYGAVPHTGHMPHLEDTGPGFFVELDVSAFRAMHAARYRDGICQQMTRSAVESGRASWADMIWYDPSVPAVSPKQLPPAFHFRESGHVYMRSGWEGPDDAWAVLTAAPAFTMYGYGSGGTGTFQIAKQGLLAGHGGYSLWSSACVPSSQNVVLVYDANERYFKTSGEETPWNDGGPQVPNFYHAREPVQRGEIVAYEHCDAYTYVAADLTRAYASVRDDEPTRQRTRSEKIRDFSRQFVFVRGNPEFFVIYDRVAVTDPAFPQTWLIHLQSEPEVLSGDGPARITAQGPGFKSYEGAIGALSRVASRDGNYWTTPKRGAVGVRTLLPKTARITKRGGQGFEVWGNPHDPKAANASADAERPKQSDIDLCPWRLEVEPSDRSAEHHFLHVVVPYGDSGTDGPRLSPHPAAMRLVETDSEEGVALDTSEGSWKIVFHRGSRGGSVSIARKAATPFTAKLAEQIRPNALPPGLSISPPGSS